MLLPILDIESKVQIGDKTRLKAVNSFVTKGSSPITTMALKPDVTTTAINIFNADTEERYLDWIYSGFDSDVSTDKNKIYFEQGTDLVATIASGTYSLSAFATEIQTKLNAVGVGFTVTIEEAEFCEACGEEF